MNSTHIEENVQKVLKELVSKTVFIEKIVQTISQKNGRVFLVGGAVRDLFLHKNIKDIDIEVHGIQLEDLQEILAQYGHVRLVGKSYGVLRIDGLDADWSIPRTDGSGRKPVVELNPLLSFEQAFRRRDVTVNAMGIDLQTYELVDPFNGLEDLKNKILRTPDSQLFQEDPLRLFRVMQFVGRFEMIPDKELNELCKRMQITDISQERIVEEFEKLLLKSMRPSLGFRWLLQIGRLKEILPELYTTVGVEQDPVWHPEGDVFEHTMQVLDKAVLMPFKTIEDKLIFLCASLGHDLGKATTTRMQDGRLRSFGHDNEGVCIAKTLLPRITNKLKTYEPVCKLIKFHMAPVSMVKNEANAVSYKRLAKKLSPYVTIDTLCNLSLADKSGRNPNAGSPLEVCPEPLIEVFRERAKTYGVLFGPEQPLLMGNDLKDIVPEGPKLGELLDRAYELQIEQGVIDKNKLKELLLNGL